MLKNEKRIGIQSCISFLSVTQKRICLLWKVWQDFILKSLGFYDWIASKWIKWSIYSAVYLADGLWRVDRRTIYALMTGIAVSAVLRRKNATVHFFLILKRLRSWKCFVRSYKEYTNNFFRNGHDSVFLLQLCDYSVQNLCKEGKGN